MADTHSTAKVDLLHPLTTLRWEQCHTLNMTAIYCAVLHDRVTLLDSRTLYILSADLHSWTTTLLPYACMSLTTYQSQFVAVGGCDPITEELTDLLFTSDTGLEWKPSLPPMRTKRYSTCSVSTTSPHVLVVAGGIGDGGKELDVVEVLIEHYWYTAVDPLPTPCSSMRATLHQDEVMFTLWNTGTIYKCSCSSLISSCNSSNTTTTTDNTIWTHFMAPRPYSTTISYSSRPVNIDRGGIIRGYCSVSQSWIEVSRLPRTINSIFSVTAALLATGDMVVILTCEVYRVKVSVSPYNPDDIFKNNILSQLEAVMSIPIKSLLASYCSQLTTSSGVNIKMLPDQLTDPVQYVEEIFFQWSMGHSDRPPTWRQLLDILQNVGLRELSQRIKAFMKNDALYVNAYRHFISTKDVLEMLFLKFLFLGPPRLGKTTARRRLMGEIIDLMSAGEAEMSHASTGAVESGHDMIVHGRKDITAVITEREWSAVLSLTDEVCMLFHNLVDRMQSQTTTDATAPTVRLTQSVAHNTAFQQISSAAARSFVEKSEPGLVRKFFSKFRSLRQSRKQTSKHNDIPEVTTLFKEVSAKSELWKGVKHSFRAYLRMEDTGGQPELMDMLPALTVGPGLYLLFFSYECDLNSHFDMFYQNASGETSTLEQSTITLKEMLLSCLSSISCSSCLGNNITSTETSSIDMQDILESSKSVAYIVGTHKDKVSDEYMTSFDQDLQKVIRDTDFFKNKVVQYFSEEKLVVSMDNMAGGKEEVHQIRQILENAMERHFKKLRIPAVWLLFSLCLRMREVRTASMETCLELSSAFNMTPYETKVALWFLHHHAGVMMYFPSVPGLEDLVIIDIQVVYDSITCLILRAMSFGNVGVPTAEKFRKTGQFSMNDLVSSMTKVSDDLIPPHKLVSLLEYLHIIARIDVEGSTASPEVTDDVYIMPCVLRCASKETLDSISKDMSRPLTIASLRLRYVCGFVPIGVFPAMMASFIGNSLSFELVKEGLMKNKVQFYYGPGYALITFLARPKSYEIVVCQLPKGKHEPHVLCTELRKEIEATLEKVSSHMNYGYFMDYQFGFECPTHPEEDHVCVVDRRLSSPEAMLCLQNLDHKVPKEMQSCHKVWFGEPLDVPFIFSPRKEQELVIHFSNPNLSCASIMALFHEKFPSSKAAELGTHLEIPPASLQEFHCDSIGNCRREMLAVLNHWLENGNTPSWKKLAAAVEKCGYKVVAA